MQRIEKIVGQPFREQGIWKVQVVFVTGEQGHVTGSKPSILKKRLVERGAMGDTLRFMSK